MSAGLMEREIQFLMSVILNAAFSRSRMNRVLTLSDRGVFFLLLFVYNENVSLINSWISVISSNPFITMNLATLGFVPITTRTFAASRAAGGSEWYLWGSFFYSSSSYSRHRFIQSNRHWGHCHCGHCCSFWRIVTPPPDRFHIPASLLSEGARNLNLQ